MENKEGIIQLPCSIGEFLKEAYGLSVGQRVYEVYQFLGDESGVWNIDEHVLMLEDLDRLGTEVFAERSQAEDRIIELENEARIEMEV